MSERVTVAVEPTAQPLTLAEAKAHLRVTHSGQDDLIADLIGVAVHYLEGDGLRGGILGRVMVERTLEWKPWTAGLFGGTNRVELPGFPFRAFVSLAYVAPDGTPGTIEAAALTVSPGPDGWIEPAPGTTWPQIASDRTVTTTPVTVRWTVGYGAASAVPATLKHALKLHIAHLYEQASAASEQRPDMVPFAYDALIAPHRRVSF